VAVRSSAAQVDTHRVRLDGRSCCRRSCRSRSALGEPPKKGARITLPVFDPIALAPRQMHVTIDAESVFVVPDSSVFDAQKSRWMGRARTRCARGGSRPIRRRGSWVPRMGRRAGRLVLATQLLG
jgi:hypothetical protein